MYTAIVYLPDFEVYNTYTDFAYSRAMVNDNEDEKYIKMNEMNKTFFFASKFHQKISCIRGVILNDREYSVVLNYR